MTILVTGSSGHLGEALSRTLKARGHDVRGLDIKAGPMTDKVGSISDADIVTEAMRGAEHVFHTATLHKPHMATHSKADFIEANVLGTERLLGAAAAEGVKAFIFTSTTSVFGHAMQWQDGAPANWMDESVIPQAKNIYGATKLAAEDLCWLAHKETGLNTLILRTSRFFLEDDDNAAHRKLYSDDNAKSNEFLYRRADIEDVAQAHLLAAEKAADIGFDKYIISATPPFSPQDCPALGRAAPDVVARYVDYAPLYERMNWRMLPCLDRVYDNSKARRELGWMPQYSFETVLERIKSGNRPLSDLSYAIGKKGYHDTVFSGDGPYPVAC